MLWHYGPRYLRAMEPLEVAMREMSRAIANPLEVPLGARREGMETSYQRALASRGRVLDRAAFHSFVAVPVDALVKVCCYIAHWRDGLSWEETGILDHMRQKIEQSGNPPGAPILEQLRRRYARLDSIFAQALREKRLRHAHELGGRIAEGVVWNGIEVHIGPGGEPILGDAGTHRLAMAQVIGLRRAPALLGFVHEEAVTDLPRLRHTRTPIAATSPR